MDKRYSQLELFNEGREREAVGDEPSRKPFIFSVNGYEKTIFLIIAFVVTGVSFYCLGIERGKSAALSRMSQGMDLASKTPAPAQGRVAAPVPAAAPAPKAAPAPVTIPVQRPAASVRVNAAPAKDAFTIQIGTYRDRASAERELAKISKMGMSAFVVRQGGFNVVVVGNFCDKAAAQPILSRLRQNYRDCYLRRL